MRKHSGHLIHSLADNGRVLILDDGSSWHIQPEDRITAGLWKPGTHVDVSTAGDPENLITNLDNGTAIRVVFTGQR